VCQAHGLGDSAAFFVLIWYSVELLSLFVSIEYVHFLCSYSHPSVDPKDSSGAGVVFL